MKKSMQKGFTLIELMIVVAIIGILAAFAVPAYQDYIARTQISEAIVLASGQKNAVTEYHASNGAFPTDNAEAGVATATDIKGKFVQEVAISSGGVVTATMKTSGVSGSVQGATITMTPTAPASATAGGSYTWTCTSSADNKYLPVDCRS